MYEKSDFYGPMLVDQVLDMAIYLDDVHSQGKPITINLVEGVISAFSPDASGLSASIQRSILASYWVNGDEISSSYGFEP